MLVSLKLGGEDVGFGRGPGPFRSAQWCNCKGCPPPLAPQRHLKNIHFVKRSLILEKLILDEKMSDLEILVPLENVGCPSGEISQLLYCLLAMQCIGCRSSFLLSPVSICSATMHSCIVLRVFVVMKTLMFEGPMQTPDRRLYI